MSGQHTARIDRRDGQQAPLAAAEKPGLCKNKARYLSSLVGLVTVLLGCYLLVFSGRFHSHDEISMFAVADSILKYGRPTTNQLIWLAAAAPDDSVAQDSFGKNGELYSKKSPLTSLLEIPLVALADVGHGSSPTGGAADENAGFFDFSRGGRIQAAALVSPLTTAATAVLLAVYVVRLGYRPRMGIAVALVYGLLSPAAVYAKFMFSEPPTALLLTAAALAATGRGALWPAGLTGLFVGLAATSRLPSLAFAPIFALYLIARSGVAASAGALSDGRRAAGLRSLLLAIRRRPTIIVVSIVPYAIGLVPPLAALATYNWLRFGSPLNAGFGPGEQFAGSLLQGVVGLLASPGKGLVVYFPIFLLILAATLPALRRRPLETALAWALLVCHLLLYGGWYQWWGGLVWGPRFLVPAVPLLLPILAPLFECASQRRRIWLAITPVFAAALGINLIGVLSNFVVAPTPDRGDSAVIWNLMRSPIPDQVRQILAGRFDLAWLAPPLDREASMLAVGLVVSGILLLALSSRRRAPQVLTVWLSVLVLAAALPVFWTVAMRAERQIPDPSGEFGRLFSYLAERAAVDDLLVTNLPLQTEWLLDHNRLSVPTFGLAKNTLATDKVPETVLSRVLNRSRQIWLPIEGTNRGDLSSGVERWLAERSYRLDDVWFGEQIRLVEYQSGNGLPLLVSGSQVHRFGEAIALTGFRIEALDRPGDSAPTGSSWLRPERRIGIALQWMPSASVERSLKVFVHLEHAGHVVVQQDAMPVDGLRPTNLWRSGDVITDRYTLTIPASLLPGRYELLVGLYEATSGQRLSIDDGRLGDALRLAVADIGAPSK